MELSELIENAFAGREMPDRLTDSDCSDPLDTDLADTLWFSGRNWREITWNDWQKPVTLSMGTDSSFCFSRAGSAAAGAVIATIDQADIRGSKPHNHDPSGAASDYSRESGRACRKFPPRVLLRACSGCG
jgi:hypothetical protein